MPSAPLSSLPTCSEWTIYANFVIKAFYSAIFFKNPCLEIRHKSCQHNNVFCYLIQKPMFENQAQGKGSPVTRCAFPCPVIAPCICRYCECFASGRYCDGCNCVNCCNNMENESTRQSAVEAILERNPNAFRPKIQAGATVSPHSCCHLGLASVCLSDAQRSGICVGCSVFTVIARSVVVVLVSVQGPTPCLQRAILSYGT